MKTIDMRFEADMMQEWDEEYSPEYKRNVLVIK